MISDELRQQEEEQVFTMLDISDRAALFIKNQTHDDFIQWLNNLPDSERKEWEINMLRLKTEELRGLPKRNMPNFLT